MTGRARVVVIGLAVAIVVVVNLPNLLFPLFEDTALFLAVGDFMAQGLLPYRDLAVQKPPGIFIISWLTASSIGTSDLAFRVVELPIIVAIAGGCGWTLRHSGLRGAFFTGAVVAGILCSPRLWTLADRGQVEFFQLAATAWSVALVTDELACDVRHRTPGNPARLLLAGALVGVACWLKPQAVALGFGLVAVLLMYVADRRSGRDRWRRAIVSVLWLVAGALAITLPMVLWLFHTGALGPFLTSVLVDNVAYVQRAPTRTPMSLVAESFFPSFGRPPDVLALCGAVTLLVRARGDRRGGLLVSVVFVWWFASALQVMTGSYLFGYHKIVLVGPASVLVAAGLAGLASLVARFGRASRSALPTLVLAGGLISLLVHPRVAALQWYFWNVALTDRSLAEAHAELGRLEPFYDHATQERAAEFVRRRCDPDEPVQVLGRAGVFWLRVGRRPATRHLITNQIHARSDPELRNAFADSLRRASPCYVLLRSRDVFPWFGYPGSEQLVSEDGRLSDLLTARYDTERIIDGDLVLLRRR